MFLCYVEELQDMLLQVCRYLAGWEEGVKKKKICAFFIDLICEVEGPSSALYSSTSGVGTNKTQAVQAVGGTRFETTENLMPECPALPLDT